MSAEWQEEWPTEPGFYWVYGDAHGCCDGKQRLEQAYVRRISNGVAWVVGGAFVFPSDRRERTWWQRIEEPELPTLSVAKVEGA